MQPHIHCKYIMHGYCADILSQSSMHSYLSARGHRDNRNLLDAGKVCQTGCNKASGRKCPKCHFRKHFAHCLRFFGED